MVSFLPHVQNCFRFVYIYIYKNDIPRDLSNNHSYLYVDDTSIFYQHNDVMEIVSIYL